MRVSRPHIWTIGEEVAHSVTHGIGLLAAIAGVVVLVLQAAATRDPWRITACAVYATTLVLLYGTSTLYHALSATRARKVFRVLDHSAIFLLIAGTYTPFALVSLRGPWGWSLLGIVWGLALLGITAKAVFGTRWPILSTALYVVMGWVVLVAVKPLSRWCREGVWCETHGLDAQTVNFRTAGSKSGSIQTSIRSLKFKPISNCEREETS